MGKLPFKTSFRNKKVYRQAFFDISLDKQVFISVSLVLYDEAVNLLQIKLMPYTTSQHTISISRCFSKTHDSFGITRIQLTEQSNTSAIQYKGYHSINNNNSALHFPRNCFKCTS